MPDRFAQVSIAALTLSSDGTTLGTPAKCFLEDASKFSPVAAVTSIALDGSVHSQIREQEGRGVAFGVRCEYLSVAVADSVREAVMDAFAGGETVRIIASDVFVNFDVLAIPDFSQGSWITYESFSGQVLKNVRMRFISTGEGS